jgi:hypothetical protein
VSLAPSVFVVGASQSSVTEPFDAWVTVIEKAASVAFALVSLTAIAMFDAVPTSAAGGVPERRPVAALNVAQVGLLAMP